MWFCMCLYLSTVEFHFEILQEKDASSKQQQHQQQQKLLPNQKQQIQLTSHVSPPLPQAFKADTPGRSYLPLVSLLLVFLFSLFYKHTHTYTAHTYTHRAHMHTHTNTHILSCDLYLCDIYL